MAEDSNSLSHEVKKFLVDELTSSNVELICSVLGYGRKVVEDINNNPLKLYNRFTLKGHVNEAVDDYAYIHKALKLAELKVSSTKLEALTTEHLKNKKKVAHPVKLSQHQEPGASSGPGPSKKRAYDSLVQGDSARLQPYPSAHYEIKKGSPGLVAIINNFVKEREGAEKDEDRIQDLFDSDLFSGYYDVLMPGRDMNLETTETFLSDLAKKLKRREFSSFFLFIMSHGDANGVKTYNTETGEASVISVDKIVDYFQDCIPDRPKVFIIQACQNATEADEVFADSTGDPNGCQVDDGGNDVEEERPTYRPVQSDDMMPMVKRPSSADFLTAFATVKGNKAYRNRDGSWFIQSLIEHMAEAHKPCYYSSHFTDLLIEVQAEVATLYGTVKDQSKRGKSVTVQQMPCYQSSLRRKLYMLPPRLPQ